MRDVTLTSLVSGQILSWNGTAWVNLTNSPLPTVSGQSGKFLTNDGSTTSWGTVSFSTLTGKPTTIAGYGITDFNSLGDARWSLLAHTHTFSSLTSKPTTFGGYGISDSSANLATSLTDENGSGKAIFSAGTLAISSGQTLTVTTGGTLGSAAYTAATAYQPLDTDLTNIAALTTATFGRSLLTQATAAATRNTLEFGFNDSVIGAGAVWDSVNDANMIVAGDNELTFDNFGAVTFATGKAALFRTGVGLDANDDVTFGSVTANSFSGTWGGDTIDAQSGGTGLNSYAVGDTLYSGATDTLTKLAGNTTTTRKFLRQTGSGTISAAPTWDTLVAGDIPTISGSQVSGGTLGATVGTNLTGTASGLTAGNVTTNANLTGDITSVGNATTIGSSKVTSAMIVDGAIVNADINASAAIDGGKISGGTFGAVAATNLTGTASININGTVGATTPAAGTFTTGVFGSTTSLLLGTAGSAVGNIGFRNATSGTATLAPPTGALGTYTVTLPNAASTLPISGQQITWSGPTTARTYTLPDAAATLARTDAANTFTGASTATSWVFTTPTLGVATATSITAPAATDLTLASGSSGGAITLTQGTNGGLTLTPNGTGQINIVKTSASSTRESIFKATISDCGNSQIFAANATNTDSTFAPTFGGYVAQNTTALTFTGLITPANDTGTAPSIGFNAYTTDSVADPLNGNSAVLTTKPIAGFRSAGNLYTIVGPTGGWWFGTAAGTYADPGTGNILVAGVIKAGSTPTTLTDSAGKVLSASLNTVAVANGGTGVTTSTGTGSTVLSASPTFTGTITAPTIVSTAAVRLKGYTVATLPGSPTQGDTAFVTDALTPAFLVTIVGGGASVAPVFYNGTNWVGY